jgi:hypothetical protein
MSFDKVEHKKKMQPVVSKLLVYLASKGVNVTLDNESENFILTSKEKEMKISHWSFYRYSGIAVTYVEVKENVFDIKPISDENYINNYMKPIIEMHFDIKK